MRFRVQGPGFRIWSLGCGVQGSGFWVWGTGFGVQGSGFRVQGLGFGGYPPPAVRAPSDAPRPCGWGLRFPSWLDRCVCSACSARGSQPVIPRSDRTVGGWGFQVGGCWVSKTAGRNSSTWSAWTVLSSSFLLSSLELSDTTIRTVLRENVRGGTPEVPAPTSTQPATNPLKPRVE